MGASGLAEIAGGRRSPERREVMRLLGSMQRFEVTEQVAWRAAMLMQEGLELATLNVRHYPMFPELERPFLSRLGPSI